MSTRILKLRFFLSKGPDVPTYVEYGAADIGIVGKDTILEEGGRFMKYWIWDTHLQDVCVRAQKRRSPSFAS